MKAIESMLIGTDFSEEAEAARRRAASIALETGASGAIVHVLPAGLPPDAHLHATTKTQEALALIAEEMGRDALRFAPGIASGDVAGELARAARGHDMIVAGARGDDILLDFGLGRTSTRLVRQCERPVLIVKRRPAEPYRRVVAAVDFSAPSLAAAAFAMRVAPKADFTLVHAYEPEYESIFRRSGATEDTIHAHRRQAYDRAASEMGAFERRLALRAPARQVLVRGYPPRMILDCARETDAQLVVIGKHAAGIVERSLVGSVSLKVLELASCDVLVVPEPAA